VKSATELGRTFFINSVCYVRFDWLGRSYVLSSSFNDQPVAELIT